MSVNGATAELGLNAKRTAVRVTGLPLLALSFQTLGMSGNVFVEIVKNLTHLVSRHHLF